MSELNPLNGGKKSKILEERRLREEREQQRIRKQERATRGTVADSVSESVGKSANGNPSGRKSEGSLQRDAGS